MTSVPYGSGRFSLIIVLPRSGVSLATFEPRLLSHWDTWVAHLQQQQIALGLPRFRLQERYSLIRALSALGMGIAFSRQADFSGISWIRLHISQVLQKTYLAIDEKGTTAAAVTSVGVAVTLASYTPSMFVDHPFFLAIRDNTTGSILFVGAIDDPSDR